MTECPWLNGEPYYCATCLMGPNEQMACEETDCKMETKETAERRRDLGKIEKGPTQTNFDEVNCIHRIDCFWPECACPRKDINDPPTGTIKPPDADWLRRKVETDPDMDCEAGMNMDRMAEALPEEEYLAARFDFHSKRYRPEVFGDDDQIAGPMLSRYDCALIAKVLRLALATTPADTQAMREAQAKDDALFKIGYSDEVRSEQSNPDKNPRAIARAALAATGHRAGGEDFTQCEKCWQPATCKKYGCSHRATAVVQSTNEPTDEMILAGAKAAADQLHYKQNSWDRCVVDDCKQDYLNAARYCWKAMVEFGKPSSND